MILRNLGTKITSHGCVVYDGVKGPVFLLYFIDKCLDALLTSEIQSLKSKFAIGVFCEELLALIFHLLSFFAACEEQLRIGEGLE
jgi:hypothetical protein